MSDEIVVNLEDEEWKQYKIQFNKRYANKEEEVERYKAYQRTKKFVADHNAKYERGEVTYTCGINQFADKLPGESICCGLKNEEN